MCIRWKRKWKKLWRLNNGVWPKKTRKHWKFWKKGILQSFLLWRIVCLFSLVHATIALRDHWKKRGEVWDRTMCEPNKHWLQVLLVHMARWEEETKFVNRVKYKKVWQGKGGAKKDLLWHWMDVKVSCMTLTFFFYSFLCVRFR